MAMRCLYHLARVPGHPSIHGNTPARLRYRMCNIVCTLTSNRTTIDKPSITTRCSKIQPSLTSGNRQTRGERGHVSLEALSKTLTPIIKYASPEIRFAVS